MVGTTQHEASVETVLFHRKIIFTGQDCFELCGPDGDFVGYDVVMSLRQSGESASMKGHKCPSERLRQMGKYGQSRG